MIAWICLPLYLHLTVSLSQRLVIRITQAKSGILPVFINEILLKHSHVLVLTQSVWASHCSGTVV